MKKFLKQTLFFLVPILVLAVVMEVSLRRIPNDYKFKASQIELEKESIKTLILGSSHSMYGFNPEYFTQEAYNLGHVSQTMDLDYLILKKYIHTLPKLETVVLRLSYTTLHEQIGQGPESWRLKDYNLYYNLDVSNNLKYNSEILSVKLKNNISIFKDYYLDNEKMLTVKNNGWASFDRDHANNVIDILGLTAAKKHTAKDDALVKENIEFLDKIVKLAKDEGVKVILVTMPAHKSYRENLSKNQLELVISAGEKMNEKYDNCAYFNLLDDNNFTEADFYDADHLNTSGAKKISLLINSLIEN